MSADLVVTALYLSLSLPFVFTCEMVILLDCFIYSSKELRSNTSPSHSLKGICTGTKCHQVGEGVC